MNSDWINPIVIKELRQGLKSKSFHLIFLGLQIMMVISMFSYLISALGDYGDMSTPNGFFWGMIWLMLIIFLPLRAFIALYEELKENTLELIFLTRMTSWDIAFGKWVALTIQMILMVSAILPYFVLRYFLGSIDITQDLINLGFTVLISSVLIAFGVGLSAFESRIIRVAILLGGLLGGFTLLTSIASYFIFSSMGGRGSAPFSGLEWWVTVLLIVGSGILIAYFVEFGASRIAPPAENHALKKRALALGVLALFIIWAFIEEESELMLFPFFLLAPICVGALCEPLLWIPTRYTLGRKFPLLRGLFYPGWPSGWIFVNLTLIASFSAIYVLEQDEDVIINFFAFYNMAFFPFVLTRLIPFLKRNFIISYFSIQISCLILGMMLLAMEDANLFSEYALEGIGAFLPVLGFMITMDGYLDTNPIYPFVTMVLLIAGFVSILGPMRQIRTLQASALSLRRDQEPTS